MTSPPTSNSTTGRKDDDDLELVESTVQPSVAPPPKQRRRPALIGLGVALIALGGLGAAWLATTVSDTVAVIALRNDVSRGEVIDESDLTTADINADPSLVPVVASRMNEMVGLRAKNDLARGSLLTADSVTTSVQPGEGEAMVGVAVNPGQLPAEQLRPGDVVRIVNTPKPQDDPPEGSPDSIEATVVRSQTVEETGQQVVDVVLPEERAAELAGRVATGRIIIVLMSRAGDED